MQMQRSTKKRLRKINRRLNSRYRFIRDKVALRDIVYAYAFGETIVLHNGRIDVKSPKSGNSKGQR